MKPMWLFMAAAGITFYLVSKAQEEEYPVYSVVRYSLVFD